jgi:hypothetical protein
MAARYAPAVAREEPINDVLNGSRERRPAGCLGLLLAGSALPVLTMAIAAFAGLGLARNLATFPSLVAALALVLLPVVGLASLIGTGSRLAEIGGCGWFWSLTLLLAMPFYFPGERSGAAASGLDFLLGPLAVESRTLIGGAGGALIDLLGDEPESVPFAGALSAAALDTARAEARRAREQREAQGHAVVPYEGQGESMRVETFFDGPRYGEEFTMVFDTGATYTTLTREALAQLELPVPADAPIAVLRTANGEIEAPLVLVDAVWLGDAVVEWVTVAVCEPCGSEGVSGLLGLNVSGQFQVSLNHDHQLIELSALGKDENRKLDVSQWLSLSSRLLRWRDGRLEVEVTGLNRAPVAITEFAAEIDCPGGRFEVVVDGVAANDERTQKMALPRGTDCSEYSLSLLRATWESTRFAHGG